jgi:hypothetical protein
MVVLDRKAESKAQMVGKIWGVGVADRCGPTRLFMVFQTIGWGRLNCLDLSRQLVQLGIIISVLFARPQEARKQLYWPSTTMSSSNPSSVVKYILSLRA